MRTVILIILLVLTSGGAMPLQPILPNNNTVWICPVLQIESPPPPNAEACEESQFLDAEFTSSAVWLIAHFELQDTAHNQTQPLGLFTAMTGARRIYLDGIPIGQAGYPGLTRDEEIPGPLEAVTPLPAGISGSIEIAVLASSHRAPLSLSHDILTFEIDDYGAPAQSRLRDYWPSLLTFGLFAGGGLYFLTVGFHLPASRRLEPLSLGLASTLACFHLLAETSRAVWHYPYPIHDLRLGLMMGLSMAESHLLLLHLTIRLGLKFRHMATLIATSLMVSSAALLVRQSFDETLSLMMLIPYLAAFGLAGYAAIKRRRAYAVPAIAFGGLCVLFLTHPSDTMDQYFFFALSILFALLFYNQAIRLVVGRARVAEAEQQRRQLEAALARQNPAPVTIMVSDKGQLRKIDSEDIVLCSGARDYVTLHLVNGETLLHDDSLSDLNDKLPPKFLRVHRSHLVNTDFVKALKRTGAGLGELILETGDVVPVSRRILPQVRKALSDPG